MLFPATKQLILLKKIKEGDTPMQLEKDLNKISAQTKIPVLFFKQALGVPLEECSATVLEAAEDIYANAPPDSETENAALIKWNELSLKEVEAATTYAQAKNAYERAPGNSDAILAALMKMVELATTTREVRDVSDFDFGLGNSNNSKLQCAKKQKMLEFYLARVVAATQEIEAATTLEEVIKAYWNAPEDSEAQKVALRKIYDLFTE